MLKLLFFFDGGGTFLGFGRTDARGEGCFHHTVRVQFGQTVCVKEKTALPCTSPTTNKTNNTYNPNNHRRAFTFP